MHGGLNAPWWFYLIALLVLVATLICGAWGFRAGMRRDWLACGIGGAFAAVGAVVFVAIVLIIGALKGWL